MKWTEKDGFAGWTGTKAAIKRFEEYKKSLPILQNTSVQPTGPERLEDDISEEEHPSLSKEEWGEVLNTNPPTMELVHLIHDFGMPKDKMQRIQILKCFTDKTKDDYPVYYNDLCRYSTYFKEAYPRGFIASLIAKYNISGKELEKELNTAPLTDEDRALLYFVFS